MDIVVNGRPYRAAEGWSVADLVSSLGFGQRQVVVELNGKALQRASFGSARLEQGDRVEVVRAVAGGSQSDRREAFAQAGIYLVAPGELPLDVLQEVIDAGVDIVQLRMKETEVAEILEVADAFMRVCASSGVPFIVNDRPDVALTLGADGVHLGQDDLPPSIARQILGPDAIIGRSTHSEADIAAALHEHEQGLADYIAVGPVHQTPTKPGRPAVGLELIRHAATEVDMPWFAIGGIDPYNIGEVADAGATRVVVVRAIVEAADPTAAVTALREALA